MRILRLIARIWTMLLGATLVLAVAGLALRALLPLAGWSAQPQVLASLPVPGANDVPPRSEVVLRFSEPMNRASVQRALLMRPPAAGAISWRDDGRTLVFVPAAPLSPSMTYTLSLERSAMSALYRPLQTPFEASFRTAPAPNVVSALPNGSNVPLDSPLAIVFSRPMVAAEQLAQPAVLPQLRIEPPVSGAARWLDQATLLFTPSAGLQGATSYSATLDANLADLAGTPLGEPFTWRFSTPPPVIVQQTPADGAQGIGPTQPLIIQLSQPVNESLLANALRFSPPISGNLSSAISGTTQIITFTPTGGWQPATTYRVELAKLPPRVGDLPLPDAQWSFSTAQPLTLAGRFPGQGQLLPAGQAIRLIFSAPVNTATLQSGLSLEPPVSGLSTSISAAEVRVLANLQPATAYTLTLATSITDRNNVPLDRTYRLRFVTAPAPPSLRLPEATNRFLFLPAGNDSELQVERTNLAALDLSLYRLDETTLLRVAEFNAADWRDFNPERYNQPLLRSWRVPFDNDQVGQPSQSSLPISASDPAAPLPPGFYYLRLRSGEGPATDLVLLVSSTLLTLQQSARQTLVWATNTSGTPVANLPLTLYGDGAVVARGTTDANGLWLLPRPRTDTGRTFALGDPLRSDQAAALGAAVSNTWLLGQSATRPAVERYRLLLLADRAVYAPNDTVQVGGFVRAVRNAALEAPLANTRLDLTLQAVGSSEPLTRTTLLLASDGVLSATLPLENAVPGNYLLRATIAGIVFQQQLRVAEATPPAVLLDTTQLATGGAQLRITSPEGLALAGASVEWQLVAVAQAVQPDALQQAFPGYSFGAEPAPAPVVRSGTGVTSAAGLLSLPVQDLPLTQTLQLEIRASIRESGGPIVQATASFERPARVPLVGVRLATQVVAAPATTDIALVVLNADATPLAAAQIIIELAEVPTGAVVLTRRVTSDSAGRAALSLDIAAGGAYRVLASVTDDAGQRVQASTPLWVAPPAGARSPVWPTNGPLQLLPAQANYQPGDTAQLLATLPLTSSSALLTIGYGEQLSPTLRVVRASELLTLPIRADFAPAADIALLSPALGSTQGFGSARLPVSSDALGLQVTLQHSSMVVPASEATITVTVRNARGQPIAADLLLGVAEAQGNTHQPDLRALADPATGSGFTTAHTLTLLPTPPLAPAIPTQASSSVAPAQASAPLPTVVAYWRSGLRSDARGQLVLRVPLPGGPARWQILAIAAADQRFGQASATFADPQPLSVEPHVPQTFNTGDLGQVGVALTNRTTSPLSVTVALRTTGLDLAQPQSARQQVQLAPGTQQTLRWPLVAGLVSQGNITFSIEPSGLPAQTSSHTVLIASSVQRQQRAEAGTGTVRFTTGITSSQQRASGRFELALAPSRLAAVAQGYAWHRAQPLQNNQQRASLLLLNATLLAALPPAADRTGLQAEAQQQIAALLAQRQAGGWGLGPSDLPQPAMSGYVLEALHLAQEAGLRIPTETLTASLAQLERQARTAGDPNLRAYLLYVLARYQRGSPQALRDLPVDQLDADGLAYRVLAQPGALDNAALTRLASLVQTTQNGARQTSTWLARSSSPLPRSPISVTALAALALARDEEYSTLNGQALNTLTLAWGVHGWNTGYDSARAAAALLARDATATADAYQLTIDGAVQAALPTDAPTATLRLLRPEGSLALPSEIALTSQRPDLPLLSYQLTLNTTAPQTITAQLGAALERSLFDPATGGSLDPAQLRVGQLVGVRLAVVVVRPMAYIRLSEQLPAAFALVEARAQGPFVFTAARSGTLAFDATSLPVGIHMLTYLVRVVAPGHYLPPGPQLSALIGDGPAVIGRSDHVVVLE